MRRSGSREAPDASACGERAIRGSSSLAGCQCARRRSRATRSGHSSGRLESEQAAQLSTQPQEVLAAGGVAVERCGEVVDRAAPPAATEAVPAAVCCLVDVQACMAVVVERARHLAMARDLDTEQPADVDVR